MEYSIRPSRPDDEEAVGEICFKTYKEGSDSRYRDLIGLRWAVPYIRYEGPHCFVAVNQNDRPIGYVLSAPQGRAFRKAYKSRMAEEVFTALEKQKDSFSKRELRRMRISFGRYDDLVSRRIERQYPAHLHIDIDPDFQGGGLGKRLMNSLIDHLRDIGCRGVHLGVGVKNAGAIRFYQRLGFSELGRFGLFDVVYMGLKL